MKRLHRLLNDRESGTTLIEMAVVLGILLSVVGATFGVLDRSVTTQQAQASRGEALDAAREAMARTSKDVRQAMSVSMTSTPSRLEMVTLVNGVTRSVVYSVASTRLQRQVDGGGWVDVARDLTSSAVFCYDPPACTAAGPTSTTTSIVRVALNVKPRWSTAPTITLATDIQIRNAHSSS